MAPLSPYVGGMLFVTSTRFMRRWLYILFAQAILYVTPIENQVGFPIPFGLIIFGLLMFFVVLLAKPPKWVVYPLRCYPFFTSFL
jgi:hypothetical protein